MHKPTKHLSHKFFRLAEKSARTAREFGKKYKMEPDGHLVLKHSKSEHKKPNNR